MNLPLNFALDVFRVMPDFGDRYKGLLVDALPLIRWEIDSSARPRPDTLLAEWHVKSRRYGVRLPQWSHRRADAQPEAD
ncbi:hypothetical protein [Streptomyces sp. NPDC058385]|uniref:hypothetical protein n=1 Tax=Streptomyces sp. NPDC058385 TaxID=3346473 RepID=UPI00366299D5